MKNGNLATRPPMGWNSFDCFNASVTEAEIKEAADILATDFFEFGWEYIVVDYCWSHPVPKLLWAPDLELASDGQYLPDLEMDAYGRLLPTPNRFPSARGGSGFKLLADYVHERGLKFGIHIMRGIPRQAFHCNLPVLGSTAHAQEIGDPNSTCKWLNQMYGVDMARSGAQAYYDSLFQLYAAWGVDFVKVDDIAFPYSAAEVEAVQQAIQNCGRPMVLSLSPGPMPLAQAAHVQKFANAWRVSSDFWDHWEQLKNQFALMADWAPFIGPGHWADADMLPLGRIELRGPIAETPHMTRFTCAEQYAFMTLCAISRSPLMFGGCLPGLDDFTRSLLTNPEVLAVNQASTQNQQLFSTQGRVAWSAAAPDSDDKYLAVFNLNDQACSVPISLADLGMPGPCRMRDLWARKDIDEPVRCIFSPEIPPHGAGLYQVIHVQLRMKK
jgi:hypothetical protein